MFVSDEASLDVSLAAAQARLTHLVRAGVLGSASAQAYRDGIVGWARLIQVHFQDLARRGDAARLALRWEAAGPGSGLFPALDADITLTPAGEDSTRLTLTGVYRPPPGSAGPELDRAVVRQVATATIRAFLDHITDAISNPAGTAEPARLDPPSPPPEQTP